MNEAIPLPVGGSSDESRPRLRPREPLGLPPGDEPLELTLHIEDPEVTAALRSHPEGRHREAVALTALRIGILALRQAQGQVDTETVRNEGTRLIAEVEHRLQDHHQQVGRQVATTLKEWFDPQSGRFNERVERLIHKEDGELTQLFRAHFGNEDSTMARRLAEHVGTESPLMKLLSPAESEGLLGLLTQMMQDALAATRTQLLAEFSLDNKEGALTRLADEVGKKNQHLHRDLKESVEVVAAEFSLDDEDSALSRLVRQMDAAQKRISGEFSLDAETSALARMRRELLGVLEKHQKASSAFQSEVREALLEMTARREESLRSTRHGEDFERAVVDFLQTRSLRIGDLAEHTGASTGKIRNCKVGDGVIEIGPDHAAAGAKIVVEAKEKEGYTLEKARDELEMARKNRGARVGLFVFSARSAPEHLEPMTRLGDDIFVVWDAEDALSDVFLNAGLSVARALCTRPVAHRDAEKADLESIESAVRSVEKEASALQVIHTSAESIQTASGKIIHKARIIRQHLEREVARLDDALEGLESLIEEA